MEKGLLKATKVHQELRVLRRMLNVAVRKKFLFANPCSGVEFPARIKQLFWNQQEVWSGRGDLNARPPAPKAGALPGCATPRQLLLS